MRLWLKITVIKRQSMAVKTVENIDFFKSVKNSLVFDLLGCSTFTAKTSKFLTLTFGNWDAIF